jgi:DnaJ-class molecular chaperone
LSGLFFGWGNVKILSDDEKRKAYDTMGHAAFEGPTAGGWPGAEGFVCFYIHFFSLFSLKMRMKMRYERLRE